VHGRTIRPLRQGTLRPFIDAWLEPLQNPHVTDDAIAVDDALNDDSPLDLCPHRIRRVLGAHLLDEDRQLHITSWQA
jgi:hypothetical protein